MEEVGGPFREADRGAQPEIERSLRVARPR